MKTRTIHYAWIGPPTKTNPFSIAGHDIAGPIKMAKQLQEQYKDEQPNPIKFWCLEEHQDFYQKQFNEAGASLEVCAIEALLRDEVNGNLASRAKYVQNYLAITLDKVVDRVAFKDLFSLFLLVTQAGYFFDTNVFPAKGMRVSLPGETIIKTAKSDYQDSNDFYIMYSPSPLHPDMLAIFDTWTKYPTVCNITAFYTTKVPFFAVEEMGVKKVSYKSYSGRDCVRGLFFWLGENDLGAFEDNLRFGDINLQIAYPYTLRALEDYSLCYFDSPSTPELLLSMPFPTKEAYISTSNGEIFYVNKLTSTCVSVYNEVSSIHDPFPNRWSSEPIKSARQEDLTRLHKEFKSPYHPAYLVNVDGCTLLHQAVLTNKINHIISLFKFCVNFDLKATFQIEPEGKILQLTPMELAIYLNHHEIVDLLQNLITRKDNEKGIDSKKQEPEEQSKLETSNQFIKANAPNPFIFFEPQSTQEKEGSFDNPRNEY